MSLGKILGFMGFIALLILSSAFAFNVVPRIQNLEQEGSPIPQLVYERGILKLVNGTGSVDLEEIIRAAFKDLPPAPTTTPQSTQTPDAAIQSQTILIQKEQLLSINDHVLTISDGNTVTLPAEVDGVIGNELTDVGTTGGLVRLGGGTALDPYKISLSICANGEVLKSNGTTWSCQPDAGGSSYTAGNGLQLTGSQFSVNSPTCAGTTKLQWNGSAFLCATDETGVASVGAINGQTKSANGAVIASNVLYMQSADASFPGLVTTGAQTIAGAKTFNNTLFANGGIGINVGAIANGLVDIALTDPNSTGIYMLGAPGQVGDMTVWGNENFSRVTYINEKGELRVIAGAANSVAMRVKQRTGAQTGDLTQWVDINNTVLTVVDEVGNIGIGGITNPGNKLEVNTGVAGSSGIRTTQVTSASSAGASNGKVLSVNSSGDIILVSDSAGTCTASSAFACDGGNTLGGSLDLGTTDAQSLIFKTNNANAATIASGGATTFQNQTNSPAAFRVLNSLSVPLFVVDTSNSYIYVGDPTADATGALLILDSKNSSTDPSGVAGGMYYNSATSKFRCYDTSWRNCLGLNEVLTFNGTNGGGAASLWSNMPAALTEFWGRSASRLQYDLTDATQARFMVNLDTAGVTSAKLRVQYSTDQVSWNYLDGGTGPSVTLDSTGLKTTNWVNITALAKADVFLRVVGLDGDGAADPSFGVVELQIR